MELTWPFAESATHLMSIGLDEDLDDAAKQAVREMVKHVCARTNLTRNEAYMLCSLAGNQRRISAASFPTAYIVLLSYRRISMSDLSWLTLPFQRDALVSLTMDIGTLLRPTLDQTIKRREIARRLALTTCAQNSPGKETDMRYLTMIVAIFAFATAEAQIATPSDFDLACAVIFSGEMGAHQSGTDENQSAWNVFSFYLGRLTARDDQTSWGPAIRNRFQELRDRSGPPETFIACTDLYKEKLFAASKR
jgi:hypothetical protein